jgi:hypothetical protein
MWIKRNDREEREIHPHPSHLAKVLPTPEKVLKLTVLIE